MSKVLVVGGGAAGMFAAIRKEISIWIVLIIILAVIDIVFGLYRKKKEGK